MVRLTRKYIAWEERRKLASLIKDKKFGLIEMAETHKEYLLKNANLNCGK